MDIQEFCRSCLLYRPCNCGVTIASTPRQLAEAEGAQQNETDGATEQATAENVVRLSAERFKRDTDPASHSPRAALEHALNVFDHLPSDRNIIHTIVLFAITTEDGRCGTRFIQAGRANHHGQIGLMAEAQNMMREAT